jgi:tRNA pseudouridine13 synthase
MTEILAALPRAHGGAIGTGQLRAVPEDFVVREWLGFEADGEGEHVLLTVRKRDANTHWVAKQLARLAGVHPREVGYAGLKDRHALCEQAFTLPVRSAVGMAWDGIAGEGFEVLRAQRHRRKLKPGALQGNDFVLVVREFRRSTPNDENLGRSTPNDGKFTSTAQLLESRLMAVATQGVPNYFGPQRFGIDGGNLQRAIEWFSGRLVLTDHLQRSLALSAARAAVFNALLAARVRSSAWNQLQSGDVANLDGSQSVFAVGELDATLQTRCEQCDLHPTGPLVGIGTAKVQGAPAALEAEVAKEHALLVEGLCRAGVEQQRRALRVRPTQVTWQLQDEQLQLSFRLRRGAFATAVLHEVLQNAFSQPLAEAVEE